YLVWRLGDRVRVYVDTRGFMFEPQQLRDGHYLPRMEGDWRSALDRVLAAGTDYFLLETTGPRGRLWEALRPHVGSPVFLEEGKSVLLSSGQVREAVQYVQTPASGGREPPEEEARARAAPPPQGAHAPRSPRHG